MRKDQCAQRRNSSSEVDNEIVRKRSNEKEDKMKKKKKKKHKSRARNMKLSKNDEKVSAEKE